MNVRDGERARTLSLVGSDVAGPTPGRFVLGAVMCLALGSSACSFSTGKDPKTPASESAKKESPDDKKSDSAKKQDGEKSAQAGESGASADAEKAATPAGQEKTAETPGAAAAAPAAPVEVPKAPRHEMSAKARSAYEDGEKAFAAGDLRGANQQYLAAVEADPKAFQAQLALGVVSERLGNQAQALKSYNHAIAEVPDYEEAIIASALLQARQGNADAGWGLLQKSQSKTGQTAAMLAAMAEVRSIQGQSGEAQKLAQEALKKDPNFKPAMVALARDHYRARRMDLALYALTGILDGYGEGNPARDKDNAEAHYLRGLIYSSRGMRGPAMEEMKKALAARPDLVDAHLVLANYMMEAGNATEARPHLEAAVRYDNKNIAAHLQLGDAYRLLDRAADARRELEWVLAADPNQAAAHYNLGLLFLLGGDIKGLTEDQALDKALEHLEAYKARAQRGGPDDVEDLITRAKTQKAILKAKQAEKGGAAG